MTTPARKTPYLNEWRIYDKSVGMVAVHASTKQAIHEAYHKAPEIIRGDLVVLAPGEAEPGQTRSVEGVK